MSDNLRADGAPLRIVHVLRAPVGGLFRHVMDLTREQIARGHQVGLIADSLTGAGRGDALLKEIEPALGLGLMRLPIRRMPHLTDGIAIWKIARRLADLGPDVVHGHGSKGGAFARIAGVPWPHISGVRCYTPHGGSFNYKPGTRRHVIFMKLERLLAQRTDMMLFESGYIAKRFEAEVGRARHLARIVRNGVAPNELVAVTPEPGAADLLYVGEFRSVKGLDTLLDSLVLLAGMDRRPSLVLVGDGPEKAELMARAQNLGVAAQIEMKPPMPARQAFAQGRVLVVPSRLESLPYIVLEAAGAHKPIVSTNAGGIPEIFGPFGASLIRPDDPKLLADAIRGALDADTAEVEAWSAKLSAHIAANFSLTKMVDEVVEAYREALAARGAAH